MKLQSSEENEDRDKGKRVRKLVSELPLTPSCWIAKFLNRSHPSVLTHPRHTKEKVNTQEDDQQAVRTATETLPQAHQLQECIQVVLSSKKWGGGIAELDILESAPWFLSILSLWVSVHFRAEAFLPGKQQTLVEDLSPPQKGRTLLEGSLHRPQSVLLRTRGAGSIAMPWPREGVPSRRQLAHSPDRPPRCLRFCFEVRIPVGVRGLLFAEGHGHPLIRFSTLGLDEKKRGSEKGGVRRDRLGKCLSLETRGGDGDKDQQKMQWWQQACREARKETESQSGEDSVQAVEPDSARDSGRCDADEENGRRDEGEEEERECCVREMMAEEGRLPRLFFSSCFEEVLLPFALPGKSTEMEWRSNLQLLGLYPLFSDDHV
uniref:Uncharacterized protein n=1 Tax=Chromera velia CCMP2878 TaxID=1169474 RepID=A0A0G4HEJ3_9ALVE|eukprot:Cvel_6500.t1-p1 / transcript=Cvel_6500.t1 / gene=Cvel_6500 / organism=Chromera_velia_CCMP2878 / gene_product=hypothetical protein / transcript_product=hypothetical protein / location=Cvel_scaffold319:21024-22148(+) / protein_length=375 / sequence_SO=supercontig / SO=protein_coding / is_pseudo=false